MDIRYLQPPVQVGTNLVKSCYMAALQDARSITGRDAVTGNIIQPGSVGSWAGALAYLVLIDHIGIHFTVQGSSGERREFIRALSEYTSLTQKEKFCLYALRCAFAHQYSLINKGKADNSAIKRLLHHQFVLHIGEAFFAFPAPAWNGTRTTSTHHLQTYVSLKRLGDLVEEIHGKLLAAAVAGTLIARGELLFFSHAI